MLSERLTKYLAASVKGEGHGKNLRSQPNSDVKAKQRALSFKPSFMTTLYYSRPDIKEQRKERYTAEFGSVLLDSYSGSLSFEDRILLRLNHFATKTCLEIEEELGIILDSNPKQYYNILVKEMLGLPKTKYIEEFEIAGISIKTIRIKSDGMPKESMSFSTFDPRELVKEKDWKESDLFRELDHEFLIPVFRFEKKPDKVKRKELRFIGAFFWKLTDEDLDTVCGVWEDTKMKIEAKRSDFVKISDDRIAHIRPHDVKKRMDSDGNDITKKSFWLNAKYWKIIIDNELDDSNKKFNQSRLQ